MKHPDLTAATAQTPPNNTQQRPHRSPHPAACTFPYSRRSITSIVIRRRGWGLGITASPHPAASISPITTASSSSSSTTAHARSAHRTIRRDLSAAQKHHQPCLRRRSIHRSHKRLSGHCRPLSILQQSCLPLHDSTHRRRQIPRPICCHKSLVGLSMKLPALE
jgi:hypothetical protein